MLHNKLLWIICQTWRWSVSSALKWKVKRSRALFGCSGSSSASVFAVEWQLKWNCRQKGTNAEERRKGQRSNRVWFTSVVRLNWRQWPPPHSPLQHEINTSRPAHSPFRLGELQTPYGSGRMSPSEETHQRHVRHAGVMTAGLVSVSCIVPSPYWSRDHANILKWFCDLWIFRRQYML